MTTIYIINALIVIGFVAVLARWWGYAVVRVVNRWFEPKSPKQLTQDEFLLRRVAGSKLIMDGGTVLIMFVVVLAALMLAYMAIKGIR